MACNLYNNDGFGCGGCTHFVRSNSIAVNTAGNVFIDIPKPLETLSNKQKICICLAQALPVGITSESLVYITINGGATAYPLRTKCGNNVHGDQLKSRKLYHTYLATDIQTFNVSPCELGGTRYIFPIITP